MEYANIVKTVYYFRNLKGVRATANDKLGTEGVFKHFWEERKKKLSFCFMSFCLFFLRTEG